MYVAWFLLYGTLLSLATFVDCNDTPGKSLDVQTSTRNEVLQAMFKGATKAVIDDVVKRFKYMVPYLERIGEVIKAITGKTSKNYKIGLQLIKCQDSIFQMLVNANNYLKDSNDALQFATLDENQASLLKQHYQTRNYQSVAAYANEVSKYFADSTNSLEKFKTQCTDATQICTDLMSMAKEATADSKNTLWIGTAVTATLGVCYLTIGTPACVLASIGAGVGVLYWLPDNEIDKLSLIDIVYSSHSSLEALADDVEAIKRQTGRIKDHAEHPESSDPNTFGRNVDIMANRIQGAKKELQIKSDEISSFMKNKVDRK